jgi:hypothetical protein
MPNHIQHDESFLAHFTPEQAGITPEQTEEIEALIQDQQLALTVRVASLDHKVIIYMLVEPDGTMIDYYYDIPSLIEQLME